MRISLFQKYIAFFSEIIAPLSVVLITFYIADEFSNYMLIFYVGIAVFLSLLVQFIIGRKRPYVVHENLKKRSTGLNLVPQSTYSFPSVHSASLGLFIPALFLISKPLFIFWILWVIFISWTRVYLNLHYATDVLAGSFWGALLGLVILVLI